MLEMNAGDPQLRHVDRAWASTVHAFQGRTVDNVIAAIEANHPNLTNQKMLYVEISRARDRAELVTDDKAALKEQLEALTGERIAALEALRRREGEGAGGDQGSGDGHGGRAGPERPNGRRSRKGPRSRRARTAISGCSGMDGGRGRRVAEARMRASRRTGFDVATAPGTACI